MGKKKPLTVSEKFLFEHMPNPIHRTTFDDKGHHTWIKCERTPTEFRRLIKARRESTRWAGSWNASPSQLNKYEFAKKAFDELRLALAGTDFDALRTALWGMENAMKFQGYNQLEVVFYESMMTGKEAKEIEHLTRSRKLQRKVKSIGGA